MDWYAGYMTPMSVLMSDCPSPKTANSARNATHPLDTYRRGTSVCVAMTLKRPKRSPTAPSIHRVYGSTIATSEAIRGDDVARNERSRSPFVVRGPTFDGARSTTVERIYSAFKDRQ